jgi:hypothetical protein
MVLPIPAQTTNGIAVRAMGDDVPRPPSRCIGIDIIEFLFNWTYYCLVFFVLQKRLFLQLPWFRVLLVSVSRLKLGLVCWRSAGVVVNSGAAKAGIDSHISTGFPPFSVCFFLFPTQREASLGLCRAGGKLLIFLPKI